MRRVRSNLEAQQLFKRVFGYQAAFTVAAPAQLELLGNQAEANEGLALSLAINQYLQIAASPRQDGKIELVSSASSHRDLFWLSKIVKNPLTPWADAIKGVLLELRKQGVLFSGFNAAIHLGIPLGAGLGDTAALQAATALLIRKLYPYKLTETGCMSRPPQRDKRGHLPPMAKSERLAVAHLCTKAERKFLGGRSSRLDHISALCGKAFHAMCVDCRFHTVDWAPMIGEVVVVLCPSGLPAAEAASELEIRQQLCDAAARALKAKNLRSVDLPYLSTHRMSLTEHEYACAYHIVGEIQRVVFAERALREGDFLQFGQYLFQSHESSRDFFRNSCVELDLLVELAQSHAGCIGARLTGAGFGGATVNLVTWNHYEAFLKKIPQQYEHLTGRRIKPVVCQIVDGAD